MILVADASPLIFLGKLDQLDLVRRGYPGEILVPEVVRDEILEPPVPPHEHLIITAFLEECEVVVVRPPKVPHPGRRTTLPAGERCLNAQAIV
ncbi:MAG: hypothetical protein CMJ18_02050 [Phycisphaeraceae bacterium]|nr:hypothetical protein [Phycisphaeraceae bacterium]